MYACKYLTNRCVLQIDCVEWLAEQDLDPDGMMRVLTHITDHRERERLTDSEALQILRRIGVLLVTYMSGR